MSKIFLIIFLILILTPFFANAQGLVPCGPGTAKPNCQFCDFFVLFDNIVKFILFKIVPPVAVLMVVIGGVLFFAAADNPANVDRARSLLKSAAIGLVIIYAAWLLINLFFLAIGVNVWTGPGEGWFKFPCP